MYNRSPYPDAVFVKNLSKRFCTQKSSITALHDISLKISQGEFFALLGPNGAGKSTLISTLGSLCKPTSGSIEILGKRTDQYPTFCKMAIGIVPQEITIDPFFNVSEVLQQQSGYYGLRNNDVWIRTLLDRLGLTEKSTTQVSRLSGGMKRRLLIAQALVHRPPVIVLDEPTAGVDIELRQRIWEFMRELNQQGHTIILTTHYLEEAQQLCNRVALINHGKLIALDTTQKLLAQFSGNRLRFRISQGSLPEHAPYQFERLSDQQWSVSYESAATLTDLLLFFKTHNILIDDLQIGPANLQEVFLRLTAS